MFQHLVIKDISLDSLYRAITQDISTHEITFLCFNILVDTREPWRRMVGPIAGARAWTRMACDVHRLLSRAQGRRRPGDAARISDPDGGDGAGPRRPPRRRFLLSGARGFGEGRAQSRQIRSRLRPC